jgi:hypothetical protein
MALAASSSSARANVDPPSSTPRAGALMERGCWEKAVAMQLGPEPGAQEGLGLI